MNGSCRHAFLIALLMTSLSPAQNYSAERVTVNSVEIVRLRDVARDVQVSIAPSLGNNAYEMKVRGKNILWFPYDSPAGLKSKPVQVGNPFLAPWANRIDQEAYWVNGRKYLLNPHLENFRYDHKKQPIHGLLVFAAWSVVDLRAGEDAAEVTSRLEFWRHPEWMAQFPFAHTIQMTYRLTGGVLEVETRVANESEQPMPLVIGFHTYYQLPGVPREQWRAHVPARESAVLSDALVPTGETRKVSFQNPVNLATTPLDDIFLDLGRNAQGRAEFRVDDGAGSGISVEFGPKYTVGIVYAPPGRNFICFEPMTGITNGFNLAHKGVHKDLLQTVPARGAWKESFWIRPLADARGSDSEP